MNPAGPRPKGRYGHALLPLGPDRAFLFGGETAGGIVNDAWLLKGLSASGAAVPAVAAWEQLEAGGALPAPRKGHAAASALACLLPRACMPYCWSPCVHMPARGEIQALNSSQGLPQKASVCMLLLQKASVCTLLPY